jgi:hypothetical protein
MARTRISEHLRAEIEWREELAGRLAKIEAGMALRDDVIAVKTAFEDLHHHLFGDGQPGLCKAHEENIEHLQGRVEKLERNQTWVAGVGAGLAMVFSVGYREIMHWLGR